MGKSKGWCNYRGADHWRRCNSRDRLRWACGGDNRINGLRRGRRGISQCIDTGGRLSQKIAGYHLPTYIGGKEATTGKNAQENDACPHPTPLASQLIGFLAQAWAGYGETRPTMRWRVGWRNRLRLWRAALARTKGWIERRRTGGRSRLKACTIAVAACKTKRCLLGKEQCIQAITHETVILETRILDRIVWIIIEVYCAQIRADRFRHQGLCYLFRCKLCGKGYGLFAVLNLTCRLGFEHRC